jgi:peptidyl-prolyl cis-trans isomerase B (cyclophilin B)
MPTVGFAQKSATKKEKEPSKPTTPTEKKAVTTNPNIVKVAMDTTLGKFVLELDKEKAPKTVENFVTYVKAGHYDKTIFHRVIPGFMVQGGGFDVEMKEKKSRSPIENEAKNGLKNLRGTIAMARTSDPHSATAQFFINVSDDNKFLDYSPGNPGYAVFGKVSQGMEVVEKMVDPKNPIKRGRVGPHDDVPLTPIVINSAAVVE